MFSSEVDLAEKRKRTTNEQSNKICERGNDPKRAKELDKLRKDIESKKADGSEASLIEGIQKADEVIKGDVSEPKTKYSKQIKLDIADANSYNFSNGEIKYESSLQNTKTRKTATNASYRPIRKGE